MKITLAYIYLIFFVLTFLHSELGIISVEGCKHNDHDICQILEKSNIPTTHAQISVILIIETYLNSNISDIDYSVMNYLHRNDFIYNPLSQFLKDDLIHLFNTLLI
ncbi:MAG: hypothetical protein EPN82_12375 [Bacteroidetes bacterium]|nr:MAG: hypothetical protein EPN82_12375 [Bacteroidota bacterium]